MERATKIDKKRFLREVDVLNNRLSEIYAELNRARNDLDIIKTETDNKSKELKELIVELNNVKIETEKSKQAKDEYDKVLSGGNKVLLDKGKEIEVAQTKLNDLRDGIDDQIEKNRIKENEALKDVREKKDRVLMELERLNLELSDKSSGNAILATEKHELEDKVKSTKKEFNELIERITVETKEIEKKHKDADGRDSVSSEREKQLNFYNKRIQRMAAKLNIQVKEI